VIGAQQDGLPQQPDLVILPSPVLCCMSVCLSVCQFSGLQLLLAASWVDIS
jgi:hypothetical protein